MGKNSGSVKKKYRNKTKKKAALHLVVHERTKVPHTRSGYIFDRVPGVNIV